MIWRAAASRRCIEARRVAPFKSGEASPHAIGLDAALNPGCRVKQNAIRDSFLCRPIRARLCHPIT